jgi:glycosyltransferase involved in cell wall biosynthesis
MAFTVGVIWRAVRTRQLPDGVTTIVISTHVNFAPVGRLVKWFANVLFAAVGHGIEVWSIQKASVREGLRRTDQLIAVSEFTKSRMAAAIGVNESRIEVLPNTFDADKFQPGPKPAALLERYGLTVDQPVILTVARLAETEQYKGYDNVLLALPAVLQRFPDARYVIVGDGPDRKRVERLSNELGVEKKVILAGYVPNEELSGHYNLCDVFVMPSEGEGFGIVFLEALGCGKPVIAGNKDASVEAVLHGKLGVMVDPDDEEQIAEAIGRVLAERDQRSRLRPATARQAADSGRLAEGKTAGGTPATTEAGGSQQLADSGQQTENREPITDNGESRFDGAMLRKEVIAAYGFERFRQRLGEIVEKLKH